jgi:hypothetical protein
MRKAKTSLSKASSYQEIGEFWEAQDLSDFWEQTKPVEFEVDLQTEQSYYPLERDLALEVDKIAQQHGVSVETLLNLWVKEKVFQQKEVVS